MTIAFKNLDSAFIYSEDFISFLDHQTRCCYFGAVCLNWIACFFYVVSLALILITLCYISITEFSFVIVLSVGFTCLAIGLMCSFISCYIFQRKISRRMDAEVQKRRNGGSQRIAIITMEPLCSKSESPVKPPRISRHNPIYLGGQPSNMAPQYSFALPQSQATYESIENPMYSALQYQRTKV